MKNKEKYDLRDISYNLEVDRGGYDFVIYYTSMEIYREFFSGSISTCSAFTKWLEEDNTNILNEKENAYISAVIKPFRDVVLWIKKESIEGYKEEWISIGYKGKNNNGFGVAALPNFKTGTIYKGMEADKAYTLEELGL